MEQGRARGPAAAGWCCMSGACRRISPYSSVCPRFGRHAMAVGNFAVLLRLLFTSPYFKGCREFGHDATAVGNFAVVLQLWGLSLCCYGCGEFRRVAMAVWNFRRVAPVAEISAGCYGCREFHRASATRGTSAVLLGGNFAVLLHLTGNVKL